MTSASSYETIATFGASLTDWGGMYGLTEDIVWTPLPLAKNGYSLGYSNGEVYTVYMADLLGIDDLQNFAVGGSTALGTYTIEEFLEDKFVAYTIKVPDTDARLQENINFQGQIDRFMTANAGEDLGQTMALVQMGLVDFLQFVPYRHESGARTFEELAPFVVDGVIDGVQQLLDAGVGKIVVNTLPDASNFPFMRIIPELFQTRVDAGVARHNAELQLEIADLVALGADIAVVDMNAMTSAMHLDPGTFGFVADMDEYIYHSGLLVPDTFELIDIYDEDQIAFYDPYHPSTAYHGVMGIFQSSSLTHDTAILGSDLTEFEGSAAQDLVLGGDTVVGISVFDGDDTVIGGLVDNVIEADAGRDILSGGSGHDFVSGGMGNDVVAGGDGDDLLDGGEGDDVLIDGLGSDTLYGGLGDDVFLFTDAALLGGVSEADSEIFVGGEGFDTLYMALGDTQRAVYEATGDLSSIGIAVSSIEAVVVVDSRLDLAQVETDTRLAEADLWGFV